MTMNFTSFTSEIYTFRVGDDASPFNVHGAAIAKLSYPLDRLLNGDFAEKQTKTVNWEHVSTATFTRLLEYAYSGDYSTPQPIITRDVSSPGSASSEATLAGSDYFGIHLHKPVDVWAEHESRLQTSQRKDDKTMRLMAKLDALEFSDETVDIAADGDLVLEPVSNQLDKVELARDRNGVHARGKFDIGAAFKQRRYEPTQCASIFAKACKVRSNQDDEQFESAFLAHVDLYVLATEKMIENLRTLCLKKIHTILRDFTINPDSILDIISLVRHAYENTGPDDPLRDLVTDFVCWRIDEGGMGGREQFSALIAEGGDFAQCLSLKIFWYYLSK